MLGALLNKRHDSGSFLAPDQLAEERPDSKVLRDYFQAMIRIISRSAICLRLVTITWRPHAMRLMSGALHNKHGFGGRCTTPQPYEPS